MTAAPTFPSARNTTQYHIATSGCGQFRMANGMTRGSCSADCYNSLFRFGYQGLRTTG